MPVLVSPVIEYLLAIEQKMISQVIRINRILHVENDEVIEWNRDLGQMMEDIKLRRAGRLPDMLENNEEEDDPQN
ncbi:hypothetical protein SK128_016629 [Halocaridina rubra]|uniref:Uncharacterized protein n=1 Tax=Halocaridina rubra TaxID=373956 RepID=A0AAN8WV80_HALRR